jgi:DNA repair protein RAD16
MLRRTKDERADDLKLPLRRVEVRNLIFDAVEDRFYARICLGPLESLTAKDEETKDAFLGFVAAGSVENNYAHVFKLLMRLRLAANHPVLCSPTGGGGGDSEGEICGVCGDAVEDGVATSCGHKFCRNCLLFLARGGADLGRCRGLN